MIYTSINVKSILTAETRHKSGDAADLDHFTPELIDLLRPVLNICNCADYTIKNLPGQKWSKLSAFAV